MFMAVAENTRSQSKAAGQTSTLSDPSVNEACIQPSTQTFKNHWIVKSLVASMSLWMSLAPVYAQIQADPSANAANRPIIGVGKNSQGQSVPVINIQTPTNGVSHNIYKQMDVLNNGVVLNNSRGGATSTIVGSVAANPFLAKGEAHLILNEVNSNIASKFEGNLEVAGQRADVIIANPAGIQIKGGGFINANKAIFTTGKPQLNADGSIKQFIVSQGKVTVDANASSNLGLGGNNNNADYVDIYARAIELNAQLHANKDIQVLAGNNTISADLQEISTSTGTGTVPTLAIDVKNLGGMYANNIYLLGTEKGLGVSNAGTVRSINNLVVTSAGKIENTGTLEATSPTQSLVNIQTTQTGVNGDVNTSGLISSKGILSVDSANDININANQIKVDVGTNSPLMLSAQGNINVASKANIRNFSTDQGDIYLDAKNISIGDNSIIGGNGSTSLNAEENITAGAATELSGRYKLNLFAKKQIKTNGTHLTGYREAVNIQTINNDKTLSAIDLNNGNISTKELNIYSSGDSAVKNVGFSLENGLSRLGNIKLYSGNNLLWNYTTKATPQFTGEVKLEADNTIQLQGALLSATQGLNLQAKGLTIGSALNSGQDINLTATQNDLSLTQALNAQRDINVSAHGGKLSSTSLKATSTQGKIALLANKDLTLAGTTANQTVITGNKGVTLGSIGTGNVTIQNASLNSAQGGIVVSSEVKNNLIDSTLTAKGNIEIFAKDNLTLDGIKTNSQQHTALNSKKNIYINSQAGTNDVPVFGSTKTSELSTAGILSLTSDKNQNIQSTKLTGGAVLLEAGGGLNTPKALELNATGNALLKNDSKLNSINGDLVIQSNDALTLDPKIHTLKAAGDIELKSKNGLLKLLGYGGTAGNGSETVLNLSTIGGGISVEGASVEVQGAKLNAQNDIKMISTKGDIIVDGVKNNFNNYKINDLIISLTNDLKLAREEKKKFDNDPLIITLKDEQKNQWGVEETRLASGPNYMTNLINSVNNKYGKISSFKIVPNPYDREGIYEIFIDDVYTTKVSLLENEVNFFGQALNGYEHAETLLNSNNGNISLISSNGVSVSGAEVVAMQGAVTIEAQGSLGQQYTSTATKGTTAQSSQLGASIIIDGHSDFYDKGGENDANYSFRTLLSPTVINGNKGVNIRATGSTAQDNLILQATAITSANGDIRIEANKSILFDAAVEQSYDRSTKTETKKSWGGLKKKTITTVAENNDVSAASVDISGKNIFIESKEKNTSNNIDMYSGRLTANGGQISIKSGGNINLYTVQETSSSNVDVTKKSSFAGIKYNKSSTNATRTQVTELPGTLKADYIGVKAENDVRLVGTEFEYLQGATIEAGRTLSLLKASTTITETLKREKNSVVWQSMQDKGSVTETAQLPRFNGPTLPEFKAAGGLIVQVPVGEKDQNKVQLRDEILKLSNQPGNEYLKELVNRKDVDWQKVILAQKDWDYKSQGLTGAGAAIIVIIVAILTYGAGTALAGTTAATAGTSSTAIGVTTTATAAGSTTTFGGITLATTVGTGASAVTTYTAAGTMINTALTSLATQSSISLINNGGDIGQTLKELGSKESVKSLAIAVVTAGLMDTVGASLNIKLNDMPKLEGFVNNFVRGVGSNIVSSSLMGESLSENLDAIILSGLTNSLHVELAKGIGENYSPFLKDNPEVFDKILHKIIHMAAGCAVGSIQKQCEAGAIGAGVGEILAESMINNALTNQTTINESTIVNYSKVISGIISAYAGYDVNIAASAAEVAVQNNALSNAKMIVEKAKRSCAGVGFSYGSTGCKDYLNKKYEMQPALRTALVRSNVTEFVLENIEDFVPVWSDFKSFKDATNGKEYLIATVGILPIGDMLKAGKKTITLVLKDGSEIEASISKSGTGYRIYIPSVGKDIAEQMAKGKSIISTTYKPNARQTINNIKGVDNSGNNWSLELIGDGTKNNKAAKVTYVDVSPSGVKTTKVANIAYGDRGPIFDNVAKFTTKISGKTYKYQMSDATKDLWQAIQSGQVSKSLFNETQLREIQAGKSKITGYTWHHNGNSSPNNMQLLPQVVHDAVKHDGQAALSKGVTMK